MAMTDKRVDEQLAEAPGFAQPILFHLRALVHRACPEVEETIKWGRPFFLYRGKMLCYMAAFTKHCGFGFVGPEMRRVMAEAKMPVEDASGSLGRITSLADLPKDAQMLGWLRLAIGFVDAGAGGMVRAEKSPKPEMELPEELRAALAKSRAAQAKFDGFSASCRREYIEWIADAKRPETRERRVQQAMEWIAEGKGRNWKHASS